MKKMSFLEIFYLTIFLSCKSFFIREIQKMDYNETDRVRFGSPDLAPI